MPPAYVKPYVRRNKTDAADAAAICEALRAAGLHLVAVKSEAQQAVLALHRTRELLVRQCTMTTNALRALLAEFGVVFGVVAAQGQAGLSGLLAMIGTDALAVPPEAGEALAALARQLRALKMEIGGLETRIVAWHKCDAASRRLASIPGIGPITASALAASVGDPRAFRTGRHLAAWLGLTPREFSSGLKRRHGRISRRGDGYLRAAADPRRPCRHAPPWPRPGAGCRLARQAAPTPARRRGGGGARQQDGAHRLGGDGAQRNLATTPGQRLKRT